MNAHHSLSPLTAALLRHLGNEEALLRSALAGVTEVHAALRRGDLSAAQAAAQPQFDADLRDAAALRSTAAAALADEIGLTGSELTLSGLAAKLPEPQALELRAARDRLAALAAELTAVQSRNANLVVHLRSFFRGVLSDLTAPDAPLRYGPSGSRLGPITGAAVQAHG